MLSSQHELVSVISQPDRPAGRGRAARPSPVAQFALDSKIPLLQPERINLAADQVRDLHPDLIVVVAFGALIKPDLLTIPTHGWLNLHFSLLPAYRGAAPVQHALLHGDDITGATTFMLEPGLDTGPIVGQITEVIRADDTTGSLLDRLSHAGAHLVLASVDAIASGAAKPVAQSADGVSLAPKISKDMARIDWQQSAALIERHVRAMSPQPGAWTLVNGEPAQIKQVQIVADATALEPGTVHVLRQEVLVGTRTAPIRLLSVRPAGKRSMPAADWVRGIREQIVLT